MPQIDYKKAEIKQDVPKATADRLIKAFLKAKSRQRAEGYFIGVDFLQQMVDSLKKGKHDGLMVKFGINKNASGTPKPYVLVFSELKIGPGDEPTITRGRIYATIDPASTNPVVVGSPPLDNFQE